MKRKITGTLLILFIAMAPFLSAQSPTGSEAEEISSLLKEISAQQAMIAENQTKVDEKLATLSETLRQARIFASRGGR